MCAAAASSCGRDEPASPVPAATLPETPPPTAADAELAVRHADQTLIGAVENGYTLALDGLLDADFSWINPSGVRRGRASTLSAPPKPVISSSSGAATAEVRRFGGDIVVVQRHSGPAHSMHVWMRRPAGWRALHVIEVMEGERVVYGGTMIGAAECINPCKVVPFAPSTPTEQAVIEAWQAQQSGPEQWARHIPDDNVARTSNGTYSKADRIAVQLQQVQAGTIVAPSPLIWAQIWAGEGAALMIALQPRAVGKPFWGSRVFDLRNGTWMMAESYQTTIQDMPPF